MQEKINKKKLIIEDILALITVFSLFMIALESVPWLHIYKSAFFKIEVFIVAIFSIEYIVRIFIAQNKFKYIFSFYGIVDLLSILPTFLGLGNFVFLKTLRLVRVSRVFRILDIYSLSNMVADVHKRKSAEKNLNFFLYLKSILVLTVVLGSLIFIFESGNAGFLTFGDSLKWALQMLFGWSAPVFPETISGEAVKMTAKISGFFMLAMLVYLIRESILEKNKNFK